MKMLIIISVQSKDLREVLSQTFSSKAFFFFFPFLFQTNQQIIPKVN